MGLFSDVECIHNYRFIQWELVYSASSSAQSLRRAGSVTKLRNIHTAHTTFTQVPKELITLYIALIRNKDSP